MATDNLNVQAECPICMEIYNNADRMAKCLPCSQGHVVCKACLLKLFETPAPYENCFLHGVNCSPTRPHATCPFCKDVFHLPNDNVDRVLSVPATEHERVVLIIHRRKLRSQIFRQNKELRKLGLAVCSSLEEFKKEVNQHHYNCNIARVSGSAPAIVGGIMFITGAALAFATFGASAGLMAAGGSLAGVGGITAGGASVAELVINASTKKKIDELVNNCQEKHKQLTDLLHQLVIEVSFIAQFGRFSEVANYYS